MSWHKVKVGDFLIRVKDLIPIEKNKEYCLVTIRLYHKGVQLRKKELGANISADKMSKVKAGQFILSGIDARNGAFGIVPPELDGAIVTNDFWHFEIDESIISKEYFLWLTSTQYFDDICNKASDGTTNRIRLQADRFYSQELFIPDIGNQHEVVEEVKKQSVKINTLENELSHQLTLLSNLNQAILQEAVQGKLLISSPPLKEEYPQGEVVENTTTHPQGEVVKNTTTHPQGEVVKNTTTHPQGEVVENTTTHPQGEVVENTTTHPQGEVVKNINNLPHLKTFRKKLRNNLTPAEAKLWTLLKGKQLENKKFRRQFSVANYILDFYCPAEHLAIELDGQGHFEASQAQYDYERDLFLNHCGIKVLRFENKWVWDNPEGLLEVVKENFGWKDRFDPSVLRTAPLQGEQLESGAELLKRIKAALRQAQGSKKVKELPPIKPEEIPFEIPENWVWCRLGEICFKITDGFHNTPPKISEGFPYIAATHVKSDKIDWDSCHFVSEKFHRELYLKATPKKGEILVVNIGAGCGTPAIIDVDFEFSFKNTAILKFDQSEIHNKYIYYFFILNRDEFYKELTKGGLQPFLSLKILNEIVIPLPPLSEQKRIVAEIEKQFALTQQLKEKVLANQQATEQLLKALLHQAFEVREMGEA